MQRINQGWFEEGSSAARCECEGGGCFWDLVQSTHCSDFKTSEEPSTPNKTPEHSLLQTWAGSLRLSALTKAGDRESWPVDEQAQYRTFPPFADTNILARLMTRPGPQKPRHFRTVRPFFDPPREVGRMKTL